MAKGSHVRSGDPDSVLLAPSVHRLYKKLATRVKPGGSEQRGVG